MSDYIPIGLVSIVPPDPATNGGNSAALSINDVEIQITMASAYQASYGQVLFVVHLYAPDDGAKRQGLANFKKLPECDAVVSVLASELGPDATNPKGYFSGAIAHLKLGGYGLDTALRIPGFAFLMVYEYDGNQNTTNPRYISAFHWEARTGYTDKALRGALKAELAAIQTQLDGLKSKRKASPRE
jgi:hypothetical protein